MSREKLQQQSSIIHTTGESVMKKLSLYLLFLPLVGLSLTGCSDDSAVNPEQQDPNDQLYGAAATDQQFFQMYAENDSYSQSDELAMNDGEEPLPMDDYELGKVTTPIRPLRWARFIRNFNRQVQLDSVTADSLSYLTVTKTWVGSLLIAATYSDTGRVPDTVIRKPFTTVSKKRFIFRRIGNTAVIWRNWRPVAVSLIAGGTESSDAINITQLKLRFDRNGVPDSVIVTDPVNTFLRIPRVNDIRNTEVPDIAGGHRSLLQVTLTSTDPDTDHVALRFGFTRDGLHRHRIRLHLVSETFDGSVYTRVYERPFMMHMARGVFALGVDATTHGTMFDDAAPVSNSFWGVPYLVTR
jgi:hypothetical protein